MRAWLAGALLCAVAAAAPARADTVDYRVDPALTTVEFSVVHLGFLRAQGRFAEVSGRIALDAAAGTGRVELDVGAATVATGWALRDAFLRGERMFDAERHPHVRFRSTRLAFADGRLARVDGDLTLRGVTRPVSLAVAALACSAGRHAGRDGCDAEATGTIRRSEFAMDFAWPLIDDAVELRFAIGATREQAAATEPATSTGRIPTSRR